MNDIVSGVIKMALGGYVFVMFGGVVLQSV